MPAIHGDFARTVAPIADGVVAQHTDWVERHIFRAVNRCQFGAIALRGHKARLITVMRVAFMCGHQRGANPNSIGPRPKDRCHTGPIRYASSRDQQSRANQTCQLRQKRQ